MSDQLAGDPIDIDPFQVVEFCAPEVEDCRAGHYANVDSFAIEYIAVHDPRPREEAPRQRLRLLAADSETNRALALFSLRLQPAGAPWPQVAFVHSVNRSHSRAPRFTEC